jgi:hypothetical protein
MTSHLAAYHFDGNPDELLAGYEQLMAVYPPDILELNVCVVRDDGMTVYDVCPSRAVFEQFSRSAEFTGAVAAAGLPAPRIESLGLIHAVHVREPVRP